MFENNITNKLNTIYLLNFMQTFYKSLLRALCLMTLVVSGHAISQTAYGISRTQTFVIDQTTGAATTPVTTPNGNNYAAQIGYESSALAVSPINGLLYMVERTATTTPRFATWNPTTGIATNIGTTGVVGADILRSTFCPDGRWYVSGNGTGGGTAAEVYQLNPSTGAIIRTLNLSGLPQSGSGDIVCTSNGTMYISAQSITGTLPYQLFSLTPAQLTAGGAQAVALIGDLGVDNAGQPNGLVEVTNNTGNCVSPCLLASGTPLGQTIWSINTSTGAAQTLTTTSGAGMVDLSREFPRNISIQKSVTPTTAIQGTATVTYTLIVRNPGPAVAANITVIDPLPATGVNVASTTWACSITAPGATTAVTSACAAPTGTGVLNTTVSLSIGGTAQIVISAPAQSTFFGTLSNTATASVASNTFDSSTANNIATTSSTITPATNLGVTKTDGVLTAVAGSTNSYTVTFTNSGPGNGAGSVIKDLPAAGLSNCSVTACTGTGTPTTAVCPAPLNNLLSAGGATVLTFPANTSLIYTVQCGITATGL